MKSSMMKVAAILVLMETCVDAQAGSTSYQYDALGRISVVTEGAAVVRYSYDAAGNRKSKQTQGGTATTITMPSSTAIERGGSIVLNVKVGGASPAGSVSFYEGTTFLGSTSLINADAIVELIGLTRGTHTITAIYSGDTTNASNSISFQIKIVNLDWLPAVLEILMN